MHMDWSAYLRRPPRWRLGLALGFVIGAATGFLLDNVWSGLAAVAGFAALGAFGAIGTGRGVDIGTDGGGGESGSD
jgi:hypothetical protein